MHPDLIFVMPVYNDWDSVNRLVIEIEDTFASSKSLLFVIVNDSSPLSPTPEFLDGSKQKKVIIELTRNMGHQKAIATGLAYVNDHYKNGHIVVMDSDGEDQPPDVEKLLECSIQTKAIVFAKRTKRNEGNYFQFFYRVYKFLFYLLTGKKISFGNFCVIPITQLQKIVHVSEIWNHFSGGVIRSGIPYHTIPTERGKRYYGESRMNFTRLVLHGLSAISVYADFMAIRLIFTSIILILFTLTGIVAVAFLRFFTSLAIPGWATFTVLGLTIILFLSLLLGMILLFNVLIMKTQKNIIPAKDYTDYIFRITLLKAHE
jgi:hypothetical protein